MRSYYEPQFEKCGHRTKTYLPDWPARGRALELMLAQGWGRLPSVLPEPAVHDRGTVDLTQLTDEELRALL